MISLNRTIDTGVPLNGRTIKLEILKNTKYKSRLLNKGDVIEVSRADAKQLLVYSKEFYKILID